eukprot:6183370-Pleurochrysis_carterae.AAC.5
MLSGSGRPCKHSMHAARGSDIEEPSLSEGCQKCHTRFKNVPKLRLVLHAVLQEAFCLATARMRLCSSAHAPGLVVARSIVIARALAPALLRRRPARATHATLPRL